MLRELRYAPGFQNNGSRRRNSRTTVPAVREEVFEFTFFPERERDTTDLQNLLRSFHNPVVVRPSEADVARATEELLFSDIPHPINNSCPISLELFQSDQLVTQLRHCHHIFNRHSLSQWFQNNVRCPVCRHDIREETISTPDGSLNSTLLDDLTRLFMDASHNSMLYYSTFLPSNR